MMSDFNLSRLNHLPNVFAKKYQLNPDKLLRQRCFNSKIFFLVMLQIVATTNSEGYQICLTKVFSTGMQIFAPVKSAFSKFRNKVSYQFFKDAFERLNEKLNRFTKRNFHGLKVVAIDGHEMILPREKDIVANGFNGKATGKYAKYRDTYYPRGYMTMAFDVLNGIIEHFTFNSTLHEQKDAEHLITRFSSLTLFLYDRLYFCRRIVSSHFKHGSFFFIRCRKSAHKKNQEIFRKREILCQHELHGKAYLPY